MFEGMDASAQALDIAREPHDPSEAPERKGQQPQGQGAGHEAHQHEHACSVGPAQEHVNAPGLRRSPIASHSIFITTSGLTREAPSTGRPLATTETTRSTSTTPPYVQGSAGVTS